jgi:hypothetical protein
LSTATTARTGIRTGGNGGWTSFTPVIAQVGSPSFTINYSKHVRGPRRTITWTFDLSVTSSGTAGTIITVTLPVTAASAPGVKGSGFLYDSSTATPYSGQWGGVTTTTIAFGGDWSGAGSWGATPNLAIASGDLVRGSITYEAAA